jgi:hypothetical protein
MVARLRPGAFSDSPQPGSPTRVSQRVGVESERPKAAVSSLTTGRAQASRVRAPAADRGANTTAIRAQGHSGTRTRSAAGSVRISRRVGPVRGSPST